MNFVTAFLLVILTGSSKSEYLQSLLCPYGNRNISTNEHRVWCKRDDQNKDCCTGFSFQRSTTDLDQGKVHVEDGEKSFKVSVRELSQGDGVYWCGLMTGEKIIVKLAEDYFTETPFNFAWSILRWILFVCLSLMTISIHIYSNRKHRDAKMT